MEVGKRALVRLLAIAVVFIVLVGGAAAEEMDLSAEEVEELEAIEAAEYYYRMAVQFYGQGRYRESVDEFARALELHDDPVMHCNRAAPLIKLEELRAARRSLERCRDGLPAGSDDQAQVDAQAEALRVIAEVVRPQSVELAREIDRGPLPVMVAPPIDPEPPVEARSTGRLGVTGLITFGVGAGLGTAAAVIDVRSAAVVDEFLRQQQGGEGTSEAQYQEARREVEFRQRVFWSLAGTGLGLATVGLGLWSWDFFRSPGEATSGVIFNVDTEGVKAGWRLLF